MKSIKKLEDNIYIFIKKYSLEIIFFIVTIVSLLIRVKFLKFESDDYLNFLVRWFNKIRQNGGILALKNSIGDYNIPYLLIRTFITYLPINQLIGIKVVSIVFDYLIAIVSMEIIYELLKDNKNKHLYALITYIIIVLLPSVFLNSSTWGQCDSIYTFFAITAILFLIKEKYIKSFIFLGIAFSFKLQTIFILPVFILVYISKRKFSILNFFIIPAVNLVMCLPAMLVGKPLKDCFAIYFNQMGEYSGYLSMNFPSIYSLFIKPIGGSNLIKIPSQELASVGTYLTLACFAIIAILFVYKNIKLNKHLIVELSLWSIMFATFLLPHMHDRYLYMADIISVIFCMTNIKKFYIPLSINLISLYVYIEYLYANHVIPIYYIAILFGIMLIIMTKQLIKDIKTNQKIGEEQ